MADVVSREPPAELDEEGIATVVAAFASAARVASRAGLDGVEIDVGAFSLLRQFHSGLTNLRTDRYGEDRLRLTREILTAVRGAIGSGRVLALRLSCDELAPWAGITPEQGAAAVADLAGAVDLLTVVRTGPFAPSAYRPDGHTPAATNLELCRAMRAAAAGRTAVVLQGSVVDAEMAEAALTDGTADLVEMTRAQIADARLVGLLRAGHPDRIRPCLLCNQTCRVRDNRNPLVTCVGDPRSGHELTDPDPDPDLELDAGIGNGSGPAGVDLPPVLIVGGGPAGLECARVLAGQGRQVVVAERSDRLGGALAQAAVGPGRVRLRRITDWLESECARAGVKIAGGPRYRRRRGTGGPAGRMGGGPGHGISSFSRSLSRCWPGLRSSTRSTCSGRERSGLGGPVVIDDPVGDAVGVGIAEWLAETTDVSVTLVTGDPVAGTLLARTGDLADANVRLQRAGVARRLRARLTAVAEGQVHGIDVWTGEPFSLPAAVVVDCGHRLPEDGLCIQLSAICASREPATAWRPAPFTRPFSKVGALPSPSRAPEHPSPRE